MRIQRCPNCEKWMGFEKRIGIGTLILFFITVGFWVFAIPFYPERCIGCGVDISTAPQGDYKLRKEIKWKQRKSILKALMWIGIVIAVLVLLGIIFGGK